jgi:CheY-like chemotaxis protein
MAETQNGAIRLDASEAEYTAIIVSLPAASTAEAARFRAAQAESLGEDPTMGPAASLPPADVLIADDDDANRAYLRRILPSPPLRLTFAANGEEALNALQFHPPAAALIDLEMPGLSGLEAVRRYREWHRLQPAPTARPVLIAFSSHQDAAARESCLRAGFDRVLGKPVGRRKLFQELRGALSPDPSVVYPDPQIKDLIPEFLETQLAQIRELEELIATGDSLRIRSVAHRLQGSFAMYEFGAASQIAVAIEQAAKADNFVRARALTDELRAHLSSLELRYH